VNGVTEATEPMSVGTPRSCGNCGRHKPHDPGGVETEYVFCRAAKQFRPARRRGCKAWREEREGRPGMTRHHGKGNADMEKQQIAVTVGIRPSKAFLEWIDETQQTMVRAGKAMDRLRVLLHNIPPVFEGEAAA